jgi:hypothetical protein
MPLSGFVPAVSRGGVKNVSIQFPCGGECKWCRAICADYTGVVICSARAWSVMFVELIPFTKLLSDAKKRNEAFFRRISQHT